MKVLIVADGKGKPSSKPLVGPGGFFLARGLLRQRREETIRDDQVVIEARGNWPREEFDYAHLGAELDAAWASHDVIVALGDTVFHTLTGSDLPTDKVRGYVFGHDGKWIIPTYDPSELLKGHQYLLPVLLWDIDKARDILHGYTEEPIGCLADPPLDAWQTEVSKMLHYIDTAPAPVVAFDIETPYKRGKNEGEVVDDADPTQTILDISFCIEATEGVTVPFVLPYLIGVKEIFQKLASTPRARAIAWNLGYDRPRVRRHLGDQILSRWGCEDTMIAHHVLFNSLDRGLGFATSLMPYNQRRFPAWKHLGQSNPTYRCLAKRTCVVLWDGTTRTLGEVVHKQQRVTLRGMDDAGNLIPVNVVGWHRSGVNTAWLKINSEASTQPIYCTPDHKVWTPSGWAEAATLKAGDTIYSSRMGSDRLIHGMLLGDGHVDKRGRLSWMHGPKQLDWFRLKHAALEGTKPSTPVNAPLGLCADVGVSSTLWRNRFYPRGVRVFHPPTDPATVAVWYLDDGCLPKYVSSPSPRISCLNKFENYVEAYEWLRQRYGKLISEYKQRDKRRPGYPGAVIALRGESARRFFNDIAPYVPPCMEYKLPPEYRGRYNNWLDERVVQKTVVVSVQPITLPISRRTRYCIDVDHPTHRFMTLGGMVKNCMDSVALWRNHQDIQKLLIASGQMGVYQQMVVKLDPILEVAEQTGLLIDEVMRATVSASLGAQQQALEAKMSQVVPNSLLPQKVWKTRKAALKAVDEASLHEVATIAPATVCTTCGRWPVTKAHVSKKFLTA